MNTGDSGRPSLLVYVHEDRLGDALLKLPAVAALRRAFPEHRVTWLAGGGYSVYRTALAPLVEGAIDEVETGLTLGRSWLELLQRPLPGRFYDIIIDTQTVLRATLQLRRIPHRLFISPAAGFLFSDRRPGPQGFGGSIRDRVLQLLSLAADETLQPNYRLRLPEDLRRLARELLPPGPVYVGIAPGAGGRVKCWPLERFLALGRQQLDRGRVPVFFAGPGESEWVDPIRSGVPGALIPEAEPAARRQGGPLLALALAGHLSLGVSNDSGSAHIFAAAGTPLVTLFGHTSVEKFAHPEVRNTVLRAGDYGGREVAAIPLSAVAGAVEKALGSGTVSHDR